MKKLAITVITWLVILVLFRCNPSDNFTIKLTSFPGYKSFPHAIFTLTATGLTLIQIRSLSLMELKNRLLL